MILKETDDKSAEINELERLIAEATGNHKKQIERELKIRKSGIKGERDTSFYLNDYFKSSRNCFVIHDLRLEYEGRVAQIDHLLINRLLDAYVIETKRLHAGVKINENGEFMRWNNYAKNYEGMASPLQQNLRHIDILKEVFKYQIEMPKRIGLFTLQPKFHSRVLVNPEAIINRPEKFKTDEVMKADAFCTNYLEDYDDVGVLEALTSATKIVSFEVAERIGEQLAELHQPKRIDYRAKFNFQKTPVVDEAYKKPAAKKTLAVNQPTASYRAHACGKCKSEKVKIEYGRYGYYFKCADCDGNTSIKVDCGVNGHKARIRKKGNQFYLDCAECESSQLYFTNPE